MTNILNSCRDAPPSPPSSKATQDLLRLVESFPSGVPPLDPVRDLRVTMMEFVQMRDERRQFESTLEHYSCTRCPEFLEHVSYRIAPNFRGA